MAYNIPDFQKAVIEAEKLLDELGYDDPPISPLEVAEYIGLSVAQDVGAQLPTPQFVEDKKDISARLDGKNRVIYVNTLQPPKHQIFSLAHQIGYFVLNKQKIITEATPVRPVLRGRELFKPETNDMKEAFHFAANLMVPFEMLKKFVDQPSNILSTIFTVPVTVINYQLRELKK